MKGRVKNKLTNFAAAIALLLSAASPALAGSVTEPGETLGTAPGFPAPPGFYLENEANYGCRSTSNPPRTCVFADIPLFAWSTPWKIFGGRLEFAVSPAPNAAISIENTHFSSGVVNPFAGALLAWDLGNNWGFSYLLGIYPYLNTTTSFSSSSLNQRFALSYVGNDWDLTANVVWGTQFNQVTNNPEGHQCPVSVAYPSNGCNPNFLNLDLTATKRFGSWELGPVAFASTDLSAPVPNYQRQRQVGVGGLVGYWFDKAIVQVYVTTNVYQKNYGANDTRIWTRLIIPLGNPPPPRPAF